MTLHLPFGIFINLPVLDAVSFWAGFGSAAFIVFLLYTFRKPLAQFREMVSGSLHGVRETLTSGTERAWREDVLRFAQTHHVAGTLFALNEILIPPRVLKQPALYDPAAPPEDEDLTAVIPVLLDWPDLSATFGAPALTVEEAFAGDGSLLILGGPGRGKTTLLAHLATRAAQDDALLFPGGMTPIFIHAADLELPAAAEADITQPLLAAAQMRASTLTSVRLTNHLRLRLKEFKCAIFLDGLDEMPPPQVAEVAAWLAAFRAQLPAHRWFVAAGPQGYGPLLTLDLAPVQIAAWSSTDYRALVQKWSDVWQGVIRARRKKASPMDVDPFIIMGWIGSGNAGRSVLEVTLKIWAAFAGDARGNRPVDWLQAYLLRFGVKPRGQAALGRLAAALLASESSLGLPRPAAQEVCDQALRDPASGKPEMDSDDFLDDMVARRLLVKHAKDRLAFSQALAGAYCAATTLASEPGEVTPGSTPGWARALYFFASLGDLTQLVARNLNQTGDIMQTELLNSALCLRDTRDAPAAARWRAEVFKRLAQLMLDPQQPETLRLRALAGFVASNDPAVAALFKQTLAHPDPFNRRVATLGLGALGDPNMVSLLAPLFGDPYLDVRWAAALALTSIGSEQAITELARGLLTGDDNLKQACAQALAGHPEEGHPILKEAITHEDLQVRRAAVYGLATLKADWAVKILERVQIEEQQWFVRNAAVDALERLKEPKSVTPRPYPLPHTLGWLVAWAQSQGLAVPTGKAAIDVLNRALHEGDEPTKRAAAEALGRLGDAVAARELYTVIKDPAPLLRDAAFRALTQIALASGQRMAAPV
jgi:HEAT repeat protein